MDLGTLTLEEAKPLEGTTFEVQTPAGETISLKLEEALPYETHQRRRPRGMPESKRQPFSLYFVASSTTPLPQGMYTLRSEAATLENVFIVPVGQDESGVEYEAIFN
jgi:hypothetical protein